LSSAALVSPSNAIRQPSSDKSDGWMYQNRSEDGGQPEPREIYLVKA
jgi:hypothetical protein